MRVEHTGSRYNLLGLTSDDLRMLAYALGAMEGHDDHRAGVEEGTGYRLYAELSEPAQQGAA